jgi:mono/diheme cytochrome c family protein
MTFPDNFRSAPWRVLIATLAVVCSVFLSGTVQAEDAAGDLAVPVDDPAVVELGKEKYSAKCGGFCHGSGGKGARAPCIVCGRYKRGGTNAEIVKNIANGIPGTPMGAFGEVYSRDDIIALVAYLRSEQKKREAEQQ